MSIVHTGLRAYAFQGTFSSATWVDDPSTLITDVQTELNTIANFSYARLVVSNVKNAADEQIELEIYDITYNSKKLLNATENDDLITDLNTALANVTNLTFTDLNIVNDVFTEDATGGWPGDSLETE